MQDIYAQFIQGLRDTTSLEFIAVVFGIASVVFSRMENILVYPTGLINTILYTYFCFAWWGLYAEGSLNFYYTVMSVYGWVLWAQKNKSTNKKNTANLQILGQGMANRYAVFCTCLDRALLHIAYVHR